MEDLINNDIQFELFSNSSGAGMLDRTLMSYPNEKTSFDVFLGTDGNMSDYSHFENEPTPTKSSYDPEKIATGITATAGAISAVGSTIQAFKGDGTKPKSQRKQLKEVCGRKPVLNKNRAKYDKCVADYNAGKTGGTSTPSVTETKSDIPPPPNNTKKIIIGLVVVGVVVTAIYGYKKGWFSKKAV